MDVAVEPPGQVGQRRVGYSLLISQLAGPSPVFELPSNVGELADEGIESDFLVARLNEILFAYLEPLIGKQSHDRPYPMIPRKRRRPVAIRVEAVPFLGGDSQSPGNAVEFIGRFSGYS